MIFGDEGNFWTVEKMDFALIFAFFFFFIISTISGKFTHFDFKILINLNKYINAKHLLIVQNEEDVGLAKSLRNFFGFNLSFSVVTSGQLENLINDDFITRKTLIISKEKINLTNILKNSPRPDITCVLFQNQTIYQNEFIPLNHDVIFIHKNSGSFTINQIFNIKRDSDVIVNNIQHWNPLKNKSFSFELNYKKNNFQNVTMDMHVLVDESFCQKLQGQDIITKVECLHHAILRLISRRLNFSLNSVECIEKENPYTYPNGTESELFIKLRKQEVDFSAASHLIWEKRFKSFDFIWPTFVLKTMMYIKQSSTSGHWKSYLKPLDPSIWWGILLTIIIIAVLLQIFEKLLCSGFSIKPRLLFEYMHSVFTVLQIFCNQGVSDIPLSHSLRILYLLMFFVVVVIFQAYTGYLVSSLTISDPYFPFVDFEGFFHHKEYKIMTIARGFHTFFYKRIIGKDENVDFLLKKGLPYTVQEAVDKLCDLDHLVFSEFREDLLDLESFKCKILELPHPVAHVYMTMVLPKNSPYREIVNRERIYLESTGITQRIKSHLSVRSDLINSEIQEEFLTVSLSEVFSIFILLGIGIVLSLLIFIFEIISNNNKTERNKKRRTFYKNLFYKINQNELH